MTTIEFFGGYIKGMRNEDMPRVTLGPFQHVLVTCGWEDDGEPSILATATDDDEPATIASHKKGQWVTEDGRQWTQWSIVS
jgi:hypothetical protein